VNNSKREANYKGVAIVQVKGRSRLLAADFHNARIDVYDDDYRPVHHHGRFVDPTLPPGYAPFNIVVKGALVFVTYAKQGPGAEDDEKGRAAASSTSSTPTATRGCGSSRAASSTRPGAWPSPSRPTTSRCACWWATSVTGASTSSGWPSTTTSA
jgi:hypothetical protein